MRRRRERTRDGSSWLLKSAETDCVDAIYDVNYIQMAIIYIIEMQKLIILIPLTDREIDLLISS